MAAWLRGEEKGPERRQWKRGVEVMGKVEIAPGVAVRSLETLQGRIGWTDRSGGCCADRET